MYQIFNGIIFINSSIKKMIWFIFLYIVSILSYVSSATVDYANTKVWGPALKTDARIHVRYLYIQAYDEKKKIIKTDLGDDAFSLSVSSPTGARVRSWTQLLNLHNGTYIGRFRMYDYSGDIQISIFYKKRLLKNFPYIVRGVYGDECDCPINQKQWMNALQCPKSFPQIEEDLKPHKIIDLSTLREKMLKKFAKHHSICHYVVKSNKIYRECHGSIIDFKMFMDAPLLSLARKVKLPDVEFFINLGDWPLEKSRDDPLPIVSWCGSKSSSDIILPTYDLTNSVLEMLGRVSLDVFTVQANTGPKWKNKEEKAFFRGRDSRQERLDLAAMSLKNPELIDAKITNYFFFKKDEKKYGKSVKHISFFEFFKYKYQLNIDGTVAAYRFPYLMLGDALVFKQDSEYYEHFYRQMEPNVHYIPLKHDLSDVVEKVKWAKSHDNEARKIQQAGTKLAREILTPSNVLCYHVRLFNELASRQSRNVTILDSMEEVMQTHHVCKCKQGKPSKQKKKKDEL